MNAYDTVIHILETRTVLGNPNYLADNGLVDSVPFDPLVWWENGYAGRSGREYIGPSTAEDLDTFRTFLEGRSEFLGWLDGLDPVSGEIEGVAWAVFGLLRATLTGATPYTEIGVAIVGSLSNSARQEALAQVTAIATWQDFQREVEIDQCFLAGTPITMWPIDPSLKRGPDAIYDQDAVRAKIWTKPIEEVTDADTVVSFDTQGNLVPGTVDKTFTNTTPEWIMLDVADGRERIHVTPGHRFLTETGDYMEIGHMLRLGGGTARLVDVDGSIVEARGEVIAYSAETAHLFEEAQTKTIAMAGNTVLKEQVEAGWRTYNFEVREHHNYVAQGIRVHNDSILSTLEPGDELIALSDDLTDLVIVDGDRVVVRIGAPDANGNTVVSAQFAYGDTDLGPLGTVDASEVAGSLIADDPALASDPEAFLLQFNPFLTGVTPLTDSFGVYVAGVGLLTGMSLSDIVSGTSSSESLTGTTGDDVLNGDAGDDTLSGNEGNDVLIGGEGHDVLDGGGWLDTLNGGAGNDTLNGHGASDSLVGGAGDDELYGWSGNDTLYGGDGSDLLNGGSGADDMFGEAGDDTLEGGQDADEMDGGSGNDILNGWAGIDILLGGSGDDTLFGGGGADTLGGGTGNDTLTGGAKADLFLFSDGFGQDVITDFDVAALAEKIDLTGVSTIGDFADLQANHLSQSGVDAFIDAGGGNTILLQGVNMNSLSADDFIF